MAEQRHSAWSKEHWPRHGRRARRIRPLLVALGFIVLAACGSAPPLVDHAVSTPAPAATQTSAPTQLTIASATPMPGLAVRNSTILSFAAPTPTPSFPEQHITAATLPQLARLRLVGSGMALGVAFSPNQPLLAVATSAGVALLDLPNLRTLRFDPIADGALQVSFSQDGQELLVTTGTNARPRQTERRRLRDWQLLGVAPAGAWQQPRRVLSPSGALEAVFPPLDSVPTPGVTLRRIADGTTIYEDTTSERIAFSPTDQQAALVSYRGTVRLLDLPTGDVVEQPFPLIASVAFSPDGLQLATAGHELQLLDVVTGQPIQLVGDIPVSSQPGLLGRRQRLRYSPDGSLLTVDGSYDIFEASLSRASAWQRGATGLAHAWDISAGDRGLLNHTTYVSAVSPASAAAAWTNNGTSITVVRPGLPELSLAAPNGVGALAFSPDGSLLALAERTGQVQLVRLADGAQVGGLSVEGGASGLVFSPDAARLGVRTASGAIVVWQLAGAAPPLRIDDAVAGQQGQPAPWPDEQFLFSADGTLLIAWGRGSLRFYQLSDGQLVHALASEAESVALGPRGRMLAVVQHGLVELWGIP